MFRRTPLRAVSSLDEVATAVGDRTTKVVLIFDVDNTLVPQGMDPDRLGPIVNETIDRFAARPDVERVIALTNGPPRGGARMESRGNKPWTTRRRLGVTRGQPMVVVGDQILIDGVLAWRLGATFLHLVVDADNEDARQARMRRIGGWVRGLLFTSGP
jgi:hypothetical protein